MLTRREALQALGVGAVAAGVAGCAPIAARVRKRAERAAFALPKGPTAPAVRLFGRAGFGHRPGDLADYARDGHAKTVERLLRADAKEDPALTMQIMRLEVFRVDAMELRDLPEHEVLRQLQQAAVLRAVYGANPLQERMSDFWTNHFCIYGRKGWAAFRKGADETAVVRENALGKFPAMLRASARSPAMLGFLDAEVNRKGNPNENYAREILELHTLGVEGGYTQRDIQEVARCFTGWTLEDRFLRRRGTFTFDPDRHDGEKTVLGKRIPAGGGERDGERVLDILAAHPATAEFLAKKLAMHFLGKRSPEVEGEIAAAYAKTGGDIRAMLRPVLLSEEFATSPPILKRPLDLVVSALRAVDATTDANRPLLAQLAAMGQPLYEWPMPDGYPSDTQTWAGAMLPRWNFAFALGEGKIEGTSVDLGDMDAKTMFGALLGRRPGNDDVLIEAMRKAKPEEAMALAVASPEFQWR
ncbi:MAG: DUF1800 domain-containing protein [Fimbriimonas sp.]